MENDGVFRQKYFKDLNAANLFIHRDPSGLIDMYESVKKMLKEKTDIEEPRLSKMAITLLAFPFTGKEELSIKETTEAYCKISELLGIE
jgi:hypothetical protein